MNNLSIKSGVDVLQYNSGIKLSNESTDLLQRLKKINTDYFFRADPVLVNKLKVMNPFELTNLLNRFFRDAIQEDLIKDPVKFLDRLASLIPLNKLQDVVKDDVNDALKEAKGMLEEAKLYLKKNPEKTPSNIRARVSSLLEGTSAVLESIITAYGIGDFFKPAGSDLEGEFKGQKIMMLLSLFSMITSILLPTVGAAVGAQIIGATLLCIAALSIIWPYIKPRTTHLPANAENWTKQIQKRGEFAQGRKKSLNEIADIIKSGRHAILVGHSRIGKSLTAKAFAQAIENGDFPELKGKVVFRINTTDLLEQSPGILGGGNMILSQISEKMGRHRDDFILVFDEIHMACKNNEKMADRLKTFLDENGEFPHVIGITTDVEYEYVSNNNAFSLRFDRVDIENTSKYETLNILSDTILKTPSKPLIKENTLHYIYKRSNEIPDAPQPATALKLLKRCINKTQNTQKSSIEKMIIEKSDKIQSLRSQAAASRRRKKDTQAKIAKLEKKISKLQVSLVTEQKELSKLHKSKELLDLVTKETYATVLKISSIAQKTLNSKNEKQLKLFLLLHEFLSRSLESHIEETAETLGVKVVINNELVDLEMKNL